MRFDTIWLDARLATLAPGRPGLGIVERGALAAKDGRIAFAGPMAELPTGWDAVDRVALDGRWVTPGLIDCHTHLVYAGRPRARVRVAPRRRVLRGDRARRRRHHLDREGDPGGERGRSRCGVAAAPRLPAGRGRHHGRDQIGLRPRARDRDAACCAPRGAWRRERDVDVVTSFLGAHALPPEANGDKERYIDEVCAMIPRRRARAAGRCGRCVLRRHRVLAAADRARVRGREGRRPAGQAACRPALQPARRQAGRRARRALGRSSRIHRRRRRRRDGARRHRRGAAAGRVLCAAGEAGAAGRRPCAGSGVPMAVATDSNPGTSPITSLLMTMNMAATLFRLDGRRGASPASRAKRRARSAGSPRSARSSRASGAISPSGISSGRPSWSTGSASIRCMRGCGEDDDDPVDAPRRLLKARAAEMQCAASR